MDSKDLEYPTGQQMDECWTAWKESGKEGLRKYLRKQCPEKEVTPREVES